MTIKVWVCPVCAHVVDDYDNPTGTRGCFGRAVGLLGKVNEHRPHARAERVYVEVEVELQ